MTDIETQLKAILGGKRFQNCTNAVRKQYLDFFYANHPNEAIREKHNIRVENREKIAEVYRERRIKEKDFQLFTVVQLKEICKEKKLKGYSKLKKAELIALLK